jgi:hypothetical protein
MFSIINRHKKQFFACALGIVLVLIAYVLMRPDASLFELSYAEYSRFLGEEAGAVIPASCNSVPPTNHLGDCPVAVSVNISKNANNLTNAITGVTSGGAAAPYYSPYYYAYGSTFSVQYTSANATFCISNQSLANLPATGSLTLGTPPSNSISTVSINCSNGVFWSGVKTVSIYSFYVPPCTDCGGGNN